MVKARSIGLMLVCFVSIATAVQGQVAIQDAVNKAVTTGGAFPAGTKVVSVSVDGAALTVDLSKEAAPAGVGDAQADAMTEAVVNAVAEWPEITAIELTVTGRPLWQYLPRASKRGSVSPATTLAAAPAPAPSATTELAGKLVVLHPSHGSYASATSWSRAMRTLCGPNPSTNLPSPWYGSTYQPSDYYYWTMGYQWGSFYEDDMSPETIRFLEKYVASSGAEVWVSRNLDKNAGDFDALGYGYPAPPFALPKWQTAAKYYLQDRGDVPDWVWNDPTQTTESNKDLRARPYYANYRMEQKFPGQDQADPAVWGNCVSFSLHSNAAGSGTARGTEDFWYTSIYTHLQAEATRFATNMLDRTINAIKNEYDGIWAEAMYPVGPNPPEWPSGTYRGYDHDGASTPTSTSGWQNRGVKNSNYAEVREAKMPATLLELAFHDDWKFYPDHVFMMDQIFRSTIAWGMYEGICAQFNATPKPRLAATAVSSSFPALVGPGQAIAGSVTMQNQGQAWCWGNKFDAATKVYGPYTVWKLKATANDQIAPGTKIEIAQSPITYPGDNATFAVALTSPADSGLYTTEWRMTKDDARGGDFGDTISAQIRVDADGPAFAITSPLPAQYPTGCVAVTFAVSDEWSGVTSFAATVDGLPVNSGDNLCSLADGSHTFAITATDGLGNVSSESYMFFTGPLTIVPADFNTDGDVDMEDFGVFRACFNGPNLAPASPGCGPADLDGDADVDLIDFAAFQNCFNGPNRPPMCR